MLEFFLSIFIHVSKGTFWFQKLFESDVCHICNPEISKAQDYLTVVQMK